MESLKLKLMHTFRWATIPTVSGTSGFSLVEVLTVVAIIGILSTLVLVAMNPAERIQAAFDSQRKSDLAQIRNSLEAYAANHDGKYPSTGNVYQCNDCGASDSPNTTFTDKNWIPSLIADGYIKRLPSDPRNGDATAGNCLPGASYGYAYISDGKDYKVIATCTVKSDLNMDAAVAQYSSSYCTQNALPPLYTFNPKPAGKSALKSLVDPRRPTSGYAVYSPGFACQ